ncbi:hypothetical protein C7S15_1830 [Burkholderia cepacia]|nr:hypothetical protein [Burkholderia cepacia]
MDSKSIADDIRDREIRMHRRRSSKEAYPDDPTLHRPW